MPYRIIFPEWIASNESTKYPFAETATLTSTNGRVILEGTFLDGAFYVIGSGAGLYLSQVSIDFQNVVLTVGDQANPNLATGAFSLIHPADNVIFTDTNGRPAGILVSESARLGIFQSFGVGVYVFKQASTEFCATVVIPTPEPGVRALLLQDGSFLSGDIWLVGGEGVVLREEEVVLPADCNIPERTVQVIRVDIVGDPLFRRALCTPNNLFVTPNPIKALQVIGQNQTFTCLPDSNGNIRITANNSLAEDSVLRIVTKPTGLTIEAVGSLSGK